MNRSHIGRRTRLTVCGALLLALAAAAVLLAAPRPGASQAGKAAISLNAPTSFPADI